MGTSLEVYCKCYQWKENSTIVSCNDLADKLFAHSHKNVALELR